MKMIDVLAFAMKEWPGSTSVFIFGDETCTRDQWEAAVKARDSKKKEWSGEGLPPVGTVCEIENSRMGWVQCEIIAHRHFDCGAKPHAIAWIDGKNIDQSDGIRFRKIKSPEQLEADARKKAVMEIISDGGSTLDLVEFVGRLYDANYRKQEPK